MPHSRSRSRPDAGDESPERPSSGTYWNESDRALSSDGTESYGPSEGFGMSEAITRALFCDVVLDGPDDQANGILPWLGNVVIDQSGSLQDSPDLRGDMPRSGSGSSILAVTRDAVRKAGPSGSSSASKDNAAKLQSRIVELLETERSYVRRIDALYQRYAIPLRQMGRDRDTAIIPLYEAQRLFGNIGEIVAANQAFLADLEELMAEGVHVLAARLGEVVLRHMAGFSCYNEYYANFEKAKHIEHSMSKNRGFREFVDRTKYGMTGLGNTGLRDLLMEPVQRIPRYKLMLDGLLNHLSPHDPQKALLEEAVVLASRIASCEADEKTKKAAVLWSFTRNVEDFPAGLISVHREFIDCIDVDDFPLESSPLGASALFSPGATTKGTLHCTLFLFDDRLAVVKRQNPNGCGRKLTGLDDLNRLADQMKMYTERSGSATPSAHKKAEMSFRGMVDIMDISALDLGGPDFQLSFSRPPSHVSAEKWSSRLVRQYITSEVGVSLTPSSRSGTPTPAPAPARHEKARFLENLWRAQALFKTREARSHVRCEVRPPVRDEDGVMAKRVVYWNVYKRRGFLAETHKNAIVLHVDLHGDADPIPFGPELAPPHARLRLCSIDDEYGECSYHTSIKGQVDDDELLVLPLSDLSTRMLGLTDEARTISELQRLHASSGPCTPASSRAKVVSGLENFGRNLLFGATPGSMRGSATSTGESGADVFGSPARRSRSAATKSSSSDAYSSATSNAHTYSTAPTSVHSSSIGPTSRASAQAQQQRLNVPEPSSPRKLVKKRRGSEVGALGGGTLEDSPGWDAVRSPGGDEGTPRRTGLGRGMESWNAKHKENASPNSASLPRPRAKSMFSPLPQSPGPERAFESSDVNHDPTETYGSKSGESANSGRRPLGPRGPVQASPGPVHRHPDRTHLSVSEDERAVPGGSERARQTRRVPSSSKRGLPLDATPVGKPAKRHARVSFDGSPSGARERSRSRSPCPPQPSPHSPAYPRTPTDARPRSRSRSRSHCPPSASPSPRRANSDGKLIPREQLSARINAQLERAQEDAEHSRSAVEKLREEVNVLRKNLRAEIVVKGVHGANPSPRVIEAQGRIPKSRFVNGNSPAVDSRDLLAQGREAARGGKVDVEFLEIWMERVEEWIEEEEERLLQTIKTRELLARDVQDMESLVSKNENAPPGVDAEELRRSAAEVEPLRTQVQSLTRKCELLTALENDGRLENTELHKAFNEELDRMYEDTQQPEDEEITALREKIKATKAERNDLNVQNKTLQRDLELERAQCEVYRTILEEHGLL